MARNHSQERTERRAMGTRHREKIVVFCEGANTEPSYIELLKRTNCKVMPVVVGGRGIGSCVEFVEKANATYNAWPKTKRGKYKQKWLMYDCDGHADFAESVKRARGYGFLVAFSNMCIEYWFALHFFALDGSAIPMRGNSHSQAQIEMVNSAIEQYNRKAVVKVKPYDRSSKVVGEDFFELMMAIHPETHRQRIIDAYERAKSIHEEKKAQGAEFRESATTVYELMKNLGVIEEAEDGSLSVRG